MQSWIKNSSPKEQSTITASATPTQKIIHSKDCARPMGFQSSVDRFLRVPSLTDWFLKESSMDLDNFTLLMIRPTLVVPSRMEPNMDKERATLKIRWLMESGGILFSWVTTQLTLITRWERTKHFNLLLISKQKLQQKRKCLHKSKNYGADMEKATMLMNNLHQLQVSWSHSTGIPPKIPLLLNNLKIKMEHFSLKLDKILRQYIKTN